MKIQISKKSDVLEQVQISRSTLYARVKEGTFPPQISLGARSVGWVQHEVDAVLLAIVGGKSNEEIQVLVKSLVEQRKNLSSIAAEGVCS